MGYKDIWQSSFELCTCALLDLLALQIKARAAAAGQENRGMNLIPPATASWQNLL